MRMEMLLIMMNNKIEEVMGTYMWIKICKKTF